MEIQDRITGSAKISYSYEGTAYDYGGAKVSSGDIILDNSDNMFSPAGHPDSLFSAGGVSRARVRVRYGDDIVFLGYATPKASFADRNRRQAKLKLLGIESIIYALPAPALYENAVFFRDHILDYTPGERYQIYNLYPDPLDTRNSFLQRIATAINAVFPEISFLFDFWREPEFPNIRNSLAAIEVPDYDLDSQKLLEGATSLGDVLNRILVFENSTLQFDYTLNAITLKGRGVLTPQTPTPLELSEILDIRQYSDGAEKVINQIRRAHYDNDWSGAEAAEATEVVEAPASVRSYGRRSADVDGSFAWTRFNAPANTRHRIFTDDFAQYLLNALERPRRSVIALAPIEADNIPPSYWSLGQPFFLRPRHEIPGETMTYATDNPLDPVDVLISVFSAATGPPETLWAKGFGETAMPAENARLDLLPLLTVPSDLRVFIAEDTYATIKGFLIAPGRGAHVFSITLSAALPPGIWLGIRFGETEVFGEFPAAVEIGREEFVYNFTPPAGVHAARWTQIEDETEAAPLSAVILNAGLPPYRIERDPDGNLLSISALAAHKAPGAPLPWHYAPTDFPDLPVDFSAEAGDGWAFLRYIDRNTVPVLYYDRRHREIGATEWIERLDFMRVIHPPAAATRPDRGSHKKTADLNIAGNPASPNTLNAGLTIDADYLFAGGGDVSIRAYSRDTKALVAAESFTNLRAAGLTGFTDIWTEAAFMYILVSSRQGYHGRIFGFSRATKAPVPAENFTTLGGAGCTNPAAIWGNENYMYVFHHATRHEHGSTKIFAFSRATKAHVPAEDFNNLGDLIAPRGQSIRGMTGNSRFVFVGNSTQKKIFAFKLDTKTPAPEEDFNGLLDAGVNSISGLATDDDYMFVLGGIQGRSLPTITAFVQSAPPALIDTGPRILKLENGRTYQVSMRTRNTSGPSLWWDPPLLVTPRAREDFKGVVTVVPSADVENSVIVGWTPFTALPAGVTLDRYRLVWGHDDTWATFNAPADSRILTVPPTGQAPLDPAEVYSLVIYADLSDNTSVAVATANFTRDGGKQGDNE